MKNIFDVHCHILPGVDDGAKTMEEALTMLTLEYKDGVRNIILTPHFRREMFEPDQQLVRDQFEKLKSQARIVVEGMQLYLGCEFHVNMNMTETLQAGLRPTMAGSDYVLAEFSEGKERSYIRERCYALVSSGYIPIIAHAERCEKLRADMDLVAELRQMGACIQVNAESILGEEGFSIKRFCKKLMKNNMLDFVGSDAHGTKDRVPNMGRAAAYLEKKMGPEYASRILIENPQRIIDNQ